MKQLLSQPVFKIAMRFYRMPIYIFVILEYDIITMENLECKESEKSNDGGNLPEVEIENVYLRM